MLTFELLGGVNEYAAWARKNQDKFYEHWIKLLPAELKAEVSVSHDFAGILEKARARTQVVDRPLEGIAEQVKSDVLAGAGIDRAVVEGAIVDGEYSHSE